MLTQKNRVADFSTCSKIKRLCAGGLVLLAVLAHESAHAADRPLKLAQVEFERGFLAPGSSQKVDISRFEQGNPVFAGSYHVDVYVNQDWVGRKDILFKPLEGEADAKPCFDRMLLDSVGVATGKLSPEAIAKLSGPTACLPIGMVVVGASASFDLGEQRLDLSVPQIWMNRSARGYVSQEHWSQGVNAGVLGYDFNTYRYGGNSSQTQNYLGLNGNLNLGGWRLRHVGSYTSGSNIGSRYQSVQTFAQHDLTSWQSQLTVGDAYTSGDFFDSSAFRGINVSTDDRMLPDSMRGYAPTVRGVANTNAKVSVKQNGVTIYETTVAPGAFEINDLYATGYGGDLNVTVQEADGRISTFAVPYAAVPLSLRPGVNRFSATVGRLRDTRLTNSPSFAQGTWQHGFTNLLTGYGGATAAPGYAAVLLGGAFNTSAGALGLDVTQSQTRISGQGTFSGSSTRISYSKLISETQTNFALAAYRYSTGGFFSLNDAMLVRNGSNNNGMDTVMRQRNRLQLSLNQRIGEKGGQLFVSGSTSNYWNRPNSDVSYSVGYNNSIGNVGYSVSANRQRNASGAMDTVYYASVTIPLGSTRPLTLSTNISRDSANRVTTQATLSGSAFEDSSLSYGVTTSRASGGVGEQATSGSANAQYHSSYADFSANVAAGTGYNQRGFGVRGAVVAHPGGITLSQPVSDTIGIIEAKGAADARVLNSAGLRVDNKGYAVVPNLTPYNLNTVELDPKGLSTDIELQSTSQQIAPRAGAVVLLKFPTVIGRSAVIHALQGDGETLPFGAPVFNTKGEEIGVVGQGSKIFARGLELQGDLIVKWGDATSQQCRIVYVLPDLDKNDKFDGYRQIETNCIAVVQYGKGGP